MVAAKHACTTHSQDPAYEGAHRSAHTSRLPFTEPLNRRPAGRNGLKRAVLPNSGFFLFF